MEKTDIRFAGQTAEVPGKEVIARAQQGDPEAFHLLYTSYKGYIARQCRRLGFEAELTEDLTQEVFILLWRKIAQFKGESAFRTWLHRITVNMIFGYFRKNRRNRFPLAKFGSDEEQIDIAERLAVPCGLDDRILISEIMTSLPSGDRAILNLYTAGYTHHEIAQRLRLTSSTSRSQLHRLRLKILKNHPLFRQATAESTI